MRLGATMRHSLLGRVRERRGTRERDGVVGVGEGIVGKGHAPRESEWVRNGIRKVRYPITYLMCVRRRGRGRRLELRKGVVPSEGEGGERLRLRLRVTRG